MFIVYYTIYTLRAHLELVQFSRLVNTAAGNGDAMDLYFVSLFFFSFLRVPLSRQSIFLDRGRAFCPVFGSFRGFLIKFFTFTEITNMTVV